MIDIHVYKYANRWKIGVSVCCLLPTACFFVRDILWPLRDALRKAARLLAFLFVVGYASNLLCVIASTCPNTWAVVLAQVTDLPQ